MEKKEGKYRLIPIKFADKSKKVHITFNEKELAHNKSTNPIKNGWT